MRPVHEHQQQRQAVGGERRQEHHVPAGAAVQGPHSRISDDRQVSCDHDHEEDQRGVRKFGNRQCADSPPAYTTSASTQPRQNAPVNRVPRLATSSNASKVSPAVE